MEANNTLKGQALHTYNRVMSAMAEDNETSMCHTFAALTQQAKSIALQSGKFSNAYVRGELKGMTAEEAAKDLTARAAACVSCKVRNIDMIIATAFLAEYISRQRKEIETPNTTTPTTSDTMNTETKAMKEVTVTISPDGSDLYAATVNGVTVGSVNTWFNNTFAASYNFGINTRKRLGMPELNNANDAAHGFMTEHNAVLWLGDMIARYFAGYGITANIVNA